MDEPQIKRRGRKRKETKDPIDVQVQGIDETNNITMIIEEPQSENIAKKRGRKPKGGKLIVKQPDTVAAATQSANIILHLRCSMQDVDDHNSIIKQLVTDPLIYNPSVPPTILTYTKEQSGFSIYETGDAPNKDFAYQDVASYSNTNLCNACKVSLHETETEDDVQIKDVQAKLKRLKIQLYKNVNQDKKSACFWCTYEYDNPSCYIPKYEMDGEMYGYGSFCRPECAVAYLMKENVDDSTKFERYHLLNQIYSKIYDFKKNIKPAPNPYFLLDKFYGNLTIQEYRKLLKTEHMLLVIDKPLTRILPELHEDNDDFILNIYGGRNNQTQQGGVYKVKRESEKKQGPSKSSIIRDTFGMNS